MEQHADGGDGAGEWAHFGADHFAQRAAVPARGEGQDQEILHRAGEDDADEDPERAGKVAHLCGEHRADQGAGAGDGGEMVTEEDDLVGGDVVQPVIAAVGGGDGRRDIQGDDAVARKQAVEAVGERVGAERGGDEPERVDVLAAVQGEDGQAGGAQGGGAAPDEDLGWRMAGGLAWLGGRLAVRMSGASSVFWCKRLGRGARVDARRVARNGGTCDKRRVGFS